MKPVRDGIDKAPNPLSREKAVRDAAKKNKTAEQAKEKLEELSGNADPLTSPGLEREDV